VAYGVSAWKWVPQTTSGTPQGVQKPGFNETKPSAVCFGHRNKLGTNFFLKFIGTNTWFCWSECQDTGH